MRWIRWLLPCLLAAQGSAALASSYGCAAEGKGAAYDCTGVIPMPWTYAACDEAPSSAVRLADWCYAFGGQGNALSCTATETFTESNLVPVSTEFERIAHASCNTSLTDSGWGQTVNGYACYSGAPLVTLGYLTQDFRVLGFSGSAGAGCSGTWSETVYARRDRQITCPAGYNGMWYGGGNDFCQRTPTCPCHLAGNPTRVADGQKILWETDVAPVGGGLLQYRRVYRSSGRFKPWQSNVAFRYEDYWESNFDSRLFVLDATQYPVPYAISAPEGTVRYFTSTGVEYLHYGRAAERLTIQRDAGGQTTGYVRTLSDDSTETFTPDGRLVAYADTQGHALALAYDAAAELRTVTDERGRSLRFDYDATGQRVALTAPDGTRIAYGYDASGNLASVTTADVASRTYRYGNPDFPHALTGIRDENGAVYAAYAYDAFGRVADTRHAPDLAGGAIEHFHFSYDYYKTTLTDPLGQSVTYTFVNPAGVQNLGSLSGPCGSCGEPYKSVQYDAAGYFASATDFNGNLTRFAYDDVRGLETSRTEASGTSAQRTTTTVPDTQWRKPALRTVSTAGGPETRSGWEYNPRGQATARCEIDPADAAAAAYRCSRDTAPPAGAAVRRWTYRYCESADIAAGTCPLAGLLLSSDGPRTDVNDVTSYSYYASTDLSGCGTPGGPCHAIGDLAAVADALGHVTTYVSYDPNGRVTRTQDANGVYTDLAYHVRGWLLSRTVRANTDATPNPVLDATTRSTTTPPATSPT